jgi:hypothetical protein
MSQNRVSPRDLADLIKSVPATLTAQRAKLKKLIPAVAIRSPSARTS